MNNIKNSFKLTSIPLDNVQYESYALYQNIFRIKFIAFALCALSIVTIVKQAEHMVSISSGAIISDVIILLLSIFYFALSAFFIKPLIKKPQLSNILCILFWVIFVVADTPFLLRDIRLNGYLFNYVLFCIGITIIPVMKRWQMVIAFASLAIYNICLCLYAGSSQKEIIDVIEFAILFCMIDMTVIYQYVSAISMLSGSKYALQNKLKLVEQEVEMARVKMSISQMKPHFLYNALTTIQTIIKVDPDYASNLIYDFTIHLRGTINALSSDSPIPFMKEMANVMAYLNIEKARFGDSLKIVQDIQDEDFNIIPLSIQPLAENAARHGIRPKGKEGGTIYIRSYALPDCHVIEVEDDGVGFDYDEIKNSHSTDDDAHKPVGIENLIFRLKTLMNADVIINSEPGRGTKITIKLPKSDDGC